MHKVTLEEVCEGICSPAMMKRIETGERLPDKLTRDRLMQRMGVTLEGYEDLLHADEYERYEIRQKLLDAIEDKKLEKAKRFLVEYKAIHQADNKREFRKIESQFILVCEYQLFLYEKGEGIPLHINMTALEEIKAGELLKEALNMTVVQRKGNGFRLLAEQEIHLLAEYLWFKDRQEAVEGYDELLDIIDNSKLNTLGKAKTYPKVIYYRIKKSQVKIEEGKLSEKEIEYNFSLCERAIMTIIGSGRSFYLLELLELWEEYFHRMDKEGYFSQKRKSELKRISEERRHWIDMLHDLYRRFGLNPYMSDFCYVFRETRSYNIGEIIRTRRKMSGMTKEQLCDNICSLKTVTRIEYGKAKTQMSIVRELLRRLGLNPEYVRERIFTNDYQVLQLFITLAKALNRGEISRVEEILIHLKEKLNVDIPENRLYLMQVETELKFTKGELSHVEFVGEMKKILNMSVNPEHLFNKDEIYLSRGEETIISRIMMEDKGDDESYRKIIEKQLEFYEHKNILSFIADYAFILTGYCSYLGDRGKYGESNRYCTKLIYVLLRCRRTVSMAANLYNLIWNAWEEHPNQNKENQKKDLLYCIYLSCIADQGKHRRFLEEQYKEKYGE